MTIFLRMLCSALLFFSSRRDLRALVWRYMDAAARLRAQLDEARRDAKQIRDDVQAALASVRQVTTDNDLLRAENLVLEKQRDALLHWQAAELERLRAEAAIHATRYARAAEQAITQREAP